MIDDRASRARRDSGEGPQKPPVRLFLRVPDVASMRPPRPGWLARLFRLDLYPGSPLLTQSTVREMNLAALILLVVAGFELAIWTALFHFLFESQGPALLAGAAFATVVCYFERQLVVHDEIGKGRARTAMGIRVVYIVVAAAITSQAFDLLVFGAPVGTRVHEEEIRREALDRLGLLAIQEANLREVTTAAQADVDEAATLPATPQAFLVQTRREREIAKQRADAARTAGETLISAKRKLAEVNGRLREIRSRLLFLHAHPEEDPEKSEERSLQAEQRAAQERRDERLAERDRAQVAVTDASHREGTAETDLKKKQKARDEEVARQQGVVDATKGRLLEWVKLLQAAKHGVPVQEPGGDWVFHEQSYDFLQKLRVLYDLLLGRPARWQGGTPQAIDRLRQKFNLYDPRPCDGAAATSAGSCDPEEAGRQAQDRRVYWGVWLVGVFIAMFIPLVVVTLKRFLFPEALRLYYSRLHQAAAGQVEAALVTRLDEQVRRRPAGGGKGGVDHA